MTQASAPAKIILFGEHAVVYGCPALAAPVSSLRAYADVVAQSNPGIVIHAPAFGQALPVGLDVDIVDNALALTVRLVLTATGKTTDALAIHLHSDIPIASGMGSGAAVSTAIARALCAHLGVSMTDQALNELVYEVEKLHHGNPSGIDNTVIVYEKPVYFVRGQIPAPLTPKTPIHLVLGDTGRAASTRDAVAGVRARYDADTVAVSHIFAEIRQIVTDARQLIETGTPAQLGVLMTRNHELLRALTVSSPELDHLVKAALAAGALGAKLSGGGRGGIMIALVTPETTSAVAQALRHSGAVKTIETEIT